MVMESHGKVMELLLTNEVNRSCSRPNVVPTHISSFVSHRRIDREEANLVIIIPV